MSTFLETLFNNLNSLAMVILTGLVSFIGINIKRRYDISVIEDVKRKTTKTVVEGIDRLYPKLDSNEKNNKAKESIVAMLSEKNIAVSDLELELLVE